MASDLAPLWREGFGGGAGRPPLAGDTSSEVAVVGGGFTGLWTAYHLARSGRQVTIVESDYVGFGASGRNGGWCSALFAASWGKVARRAGVEAAHRLQQALVGTVRDVVETCREEGIDADATMGGSLRFARSAAQETRLRGEVDEAARWGVQLRWLDADEATDRVVAAGVRGATFTPHCATVHPGRLVRGLALAAERHGVRIHEGTRARRLERGRVVTDGGSIRARVVVRATEAYTARLPGSRRALAPVYSLMIATEPLGEEIWSKLRWDARETVADGRHLIIYAQRTADGRIAFGGRGAPYHYGSRIRPEFDGVRAVHDGLRRAMVEMFPVLEDVAVTHRWGGPLGVPRDWFPSVGYDQEAGIAWAGGYVGDGVACSALAGRTLAQLIDGQRSELTALPWVGARSPRWEPEPLRWLGLNAGLKIMASADQAEARTGRPARRAEWFSRFIGG